MHVKRDPAGLDSQATADCCPTVCLGQAITQVLRRNDWVKDFDPLLAILNCTSKHLLHVF